MLFDCVWKKHALPRTAALVAFFVVLLCTHKNAESLNARALNFPFESSCRAHRAVCGVVRCGVSFWKLSVKSQSHATGVHSTFATPVQRRLILHRARGRCSPVSSGVLRASVPTLCPHPLRAHTQSFRNAHWRHLPPCGTNRARWLYVIRAKRAPWLHDVSN